MRHPARPGQPGPQTARSSGLVSVPLSAGDLMRFWLRTGDGEGSSLNQETLRLSVNKTDFSQPKAVKSEEQQMLALPGPGLGIGQISVLLPPLSRCRRTHWKRDGSLCQISLICLDWWAQEQERTSFLLFSFLFSSRTSINKSIFRKVISNYSLKFYGRFLWSLKGWC